MDKSVLNFELSEQVNNLIQNLESQIGSEINIKKINFPAKDMHATACGGFDNWTPFIGINIQLREKFDEHALTHELLHIKRFFEGAYILETPDRLNGRNDTDSQNRIKFVDDVTDQIEHIAIFPELISYGFDPNKLADEWKKNQIKDISLVSSKWGPVDHSWACIKVGVAEHLGSDKKLNEEYKACFQKVDPDSIKKGIEIAKSISKWGLKKEYNMKRLYKQMLELANIPKNVLLLKQLDFDLKKERLEAI